MSETAFNDKFFLSDVIKRISYVFRDLNEISNTFDIAFGSSKALAFTSHSEEIKCGLLRHGRTFDNSFDDITPPDERR